MANQSRALPQNTPGDFFVDSSCIDCDACRQIAPTVFRDHGTASSVWHQPSDDAELRLALMALVACPTGSIGTRERHDARIGVDAFPSHVVDDVYFCGFTAESSFGAWSYLVVRPAERGGNLLIDSPRWTPSLASKIESLGGIATILLTHRDDIADHDRWAARFDAPRVMHAWDGAARLGIEQVINDIEPIRFDDEITIIPVPGHTRGSVMFLYRDRVLFTGDSLAWDVRDDTLTAFRDACWYSWPTQMESLERLLEYRFEWVVPGHGRIGSASAERMRELLAELIA